MKIETQAEVQKGKDGVAGSLNRPQEVSRSLGATNTEYVNWESNRPKESGRQRRIAKLQRQETAGGHKQGPFYKHREAGGDGCHTGIDHDKGATE